MVSRERSYARGLDAFNAGRFYEAHELWEARWLVEPDAQVKTMLQGLIQLAAAGHKLRTGDRVRGGPTLLRRAADKLEVADGALGVPGAALAAEARALEPIAIARIEAGQTTADLPIPGPCGPVTPHTAPREKA